MQSQNKISIVIPCFNQAHFLPDCIDSILVQTYRNWEAIVVNDGSPDDVEGAIKPYANQDSRIIYIEKRNGGLSSARNAGLKIASGKWIIFLDSDDLITPEFLRKQMDVLSIHKKISFSYCNHWRGESSNPKIPIKQKNPSCEFILKKPIHDMTIRWESDFGIPIHCAVFDVRIFRDFDIHFNETLPNHEDWDVWMRILNLEPEIFYLPEKLAIYRTSPTSMSRNSNLMWKGFTAAIRIQIDIFSNDKEMINYLIYKQKITNYKYGKTIKGFIHKKICQNPFFKNNCPWPIQRLVSLLTQGPSLK